MTEAPEVVDAQTRARDLEALWRRTLEEAGIRRSMLIASTFRSGSTWVATLLNRNGLPKMGREGLNKSWKMLNDQPPYPIAQDVFATALAQQSGDVLATKLMWSHRNQFAKILGYKRSDSAALAALFPQATWIHVTRRDIFAQSVSFWRAKQTGRWHVYDGQEEPRPDYDFDEIAKALRELQLHDRMWRDFFGQAGITPLRIVYEDLMADTEGTLPGILTELKAEIPPEGPVFKVGLKRQSDGWSAALLAPLLEDLYLPRRGL